jgi:hypothetical protein
MLLATLVHHVVLTFIAISINVNYWTEKKTESLEEVDGRFIFIKDLESTEVNFTEKFIAMIIGVTHTLAMIWLVALVSFTLYLRAKKITAYQYKQNKSVKLN